LRKVYDSYNAIYQTKNSALQIDIWLAKIAYQEARKVLPEGFARFLNSIYEKVNKNPDQFKDFLEVFVAYHRFFNPKATN
jgi:CRISPR-associated protein, csm2 family